MGLEHGKVAEVRYFGSVCIYRNLFSFLPNYVVDPDTGQVIGIFPRPPSTTGIDALVFTVNPANISCGYGYTYQYQAVFDPVNATVPPIPTSTPPASQTPAPTLPATASPVVTATPTGTEGGISTAVIAAIVVIIVIIIIAIVAIATRRKK